MPCWSRNRAACRGVLLAAAALSMAAGNAPATSLQPHRNLEDLTWTELRDAVAAGARTAIVPIGGVEQSGPAIALGKHNARVRLLSARIADELGNCIIAPVVAYVPEGNIAPPSGHMRFPGTLTVPPAVFESGLESIIRSLRAAGFRDIVLLGDHGGYQGQLARLASRLDHAWAGEATRVFSPPAYYRAASEGFARLLRERGFRDDEIGTHAALADTALQLAVDSSMVRGDVLASTAQLDAGSGVMGGDPRRATAALGQLGLDEIVRTTVAEIRSLQAQAARGPARSVAVPAPAGH